jgi:hypothetical protein
MIRALAPRLVLGALLLVGLELLPWAHPGARSPLEWPLLLAGTTALAALLLDGAARLRMRDGFGVLALAGLAGVAAALLFNPDYALANPPATWFTRALGSLTLGGLAALLLFLRLGRPVSRRAGLLALAAAAPLGALWGYWARWSPQEAGAAAAPTPPETVLLAGALAWAAVLAALALAQRGRSADMPDLRLPRPALALLLLGLLAWLAWRVTGDMVDPLSALVLGVAGLMCAAILYYQKRDRGLTLLGRMSAVPAAGWLRWMPLLAVLTLVAAGIGASLPRGAADGDALVFMAAAVTVFGFVWLPGVALVIGARAFSRRARMDRL